MTTTVKLPIKLSNGSTDADVRALGITYGPFLGEDGLFREAALPEGWTLDTEGHPMWTHIRDTHGRRRVSIFTGPQDTPERDAFAYVATVYDYVVNTIQEGVALITDDTWATPKAIIEAARERAREAVRLLRMYERIPSDRSWHIARQKDIRDRYTAIADQFEGAST